MARRHRSKAKLFQDIELPFGAEQVEWWECAHGVLYPPSATYLQCACKPRGDHV